LQETLKSSNFTYLQPQQTSHNKQSSSVLATDA